MYGLQHTGLKQHCVLFGLQQAACIFFIVFKKCTQSALYFYWGFYYFFSFPKNHKTKLIHGIKGRHGYTCGLASWGAVTALVTMLNKTIPQRQGGVWSLARPAQGRAMPFSFTTVARLPTIASHASFPHSL